MSGNLIERRFAGGAAGSPLVVRHAMWAAVGGDITAPNTAGAWQLVADTHIDLPAAAGDYVELLHTQMVGSGTSVFLDWVIAVDGAIAWAASSRSATPRLEGLPSLYPTPGSYRTAGSVVELTAESGHIDDGVVRFQLAVKASGSGTIYKSSNFPLILAARNHGPVDDDGA